MNVTTEDTEDTEKVVERPKKSPHTQRRRVGHPGGRVAQSKRFKMGQGLERVVQVGMSGGGSFPPGEIRKGLFSLRLLGFET